MMALGNPSTESLIGAYLCSEIGSYILWCHVFERKRLFILDYLYKAGFIFLNCSQNS